MLADFLPHILIVIGIGGGLAMLIRRSRTLSNEDLKLFEGDSKFLKRLEGLWTEQIVEKFPKEEIEEKALLFAEKAVRRSRIFVTRLDTFLSRVQGRVQAIRKNQVLDPAYWLTLKISHKNGEGVQYNGDRLDPSVEEVRLRKNASQTAGAFVNLARLYLARHHYADARRSLLIAWRLDPDDKAVLSLLRDIRKEEKERAGVAAAQEL